MESYSPKSITPFLRWAGSKRQIIPILSEYWKPSSHRYVEPFAGSASLFFHLLPQKALLADINKELILTYRQIKTNLDPVIKELNNFKNDKEQYLRIRSINPRTLSPPVQAARFIFLNRFCFNGLYRTNRQGDFNVPYGGGKTGNIPTVQEFQHYSNVLKNASLLSMDFEQTLRKVREGDFVYMDPPYTIKNRRVFNEYSANSFDHQKIRKLREWLVILSNKNISFLVSYADSDEASFLSKGYNTRQVVVKRNIAGFANNRKIDKEILIFNS
jgi:DNA adenine methylase